MKIFNKNGLPYSICVLFTPGVVVLPILENQDSKNSLNQVRAVK